MKKLLRISALITAALMVFVMIGCGGDDEEKDTTPPTLVSASPASGATIAANAQITLTFSETMGSVSVTGGTVTLSGKTAIVAPAGGAWASGSLTVTGEDKAGNALSAVTLTYTLGAADSTPPKIDDGACSPKNGATGVDPADVKEIKIVFDETMSDAKVTSAGALDGKVSGEFDKDRTLTVKFLGGYKLGNEVEVVLTLSGKDVAGNDLATTKYTFTTMAKEE
jgi:hypothetical protein